MDRKTYEYVSKKTNDPIVEWRKCAFTQEPFAITRKDVEFYEKVSPTVKGEKQAIPLPTLSPEVRHQRRMAFGNWSFFYRRKCDYSGKSLLGQFSAEAKATVYERSVWESDAWNAFDFAKEYDFKRPFFAQFGELLQKVPLPHNASFSSENCDYSFTTFSKDCYFLCIGGECSGVFYSEWLMESKDSFESVDSTHLENCSDCIEVSKAYGCHALVRSENCDDVHYSVNMVGCSHCVLCHGLTNQSYCIRNVQYEEKDWKKAVTELRANGSYAREKALLEEFERLLEGGARKGLKILRSEHCFGNIVEDSSEIVFGTHSTESKRCKFGFLANFHNEDCYDTSSYYSRLCLESVSWGPTYHCLFCFDLRENNRDLLYSAYCENCENCFGCVGLKNARYCVLNRQYSKEAYEDLVLKIIAHMRETGEWGEFFDPKISPFSYDGSEAGIYRPMKPSDSEAEKFHFYTIAKPEYGTLKSIPANRLPDSINDVGDDVADWAIECVQTGRHFRILKQELDFLKKHRLPLPRLHPEIRRSRRAKYRSGTDFFLLGEGEDAMLSVRSGVSAGQ